MDRNEMEKLMDRYKKEMLEFQKKNGYAPSDSREKSIFDASQSGEKYERDRSDPLENESQNIVQEQARAAQAPVMQEPAEPPRMSGGYIDVISALREKCENSANDSQATQAQKLRCSELNDYLNINSETGVLSIRTYAGEQSFAVPSVRVMIFLPLPSGNITLYDGITDISGLSDSVILPAPSKALSMSPRSDRVLPYAEYTVYVEHPSFVRALFNNVPVFSNIESVQPVAMIAKSAGAQDPEPIVVDESGLRLL